MAPPQSMGGVMTGCCISGGRALKPATPATRRRIVGIFILNMMLDVLDVLD